ncbi:Hypothetical_protein [Hexamita inflata]|uniref:Hypothetical_protein n=1 Tax=Hexamita inflata TaxID=28002 RepID=A0ABP1IK13_9EUKA
MNIQVLLGQLYSWDQGLTFPSFAGRKYRFCWEFGDIGRFLVFVLGNNQQQSAIKTLKIKTGRFPARNRRIRPGLTHQISFLFNKIDIFQALYVVYAYQTSTLCYLSHQQ